MQVYLSIFGTCQERRRSRWNINRLNRKSGAFPQIERQSRKKNSDYQNTAFPE
jgi:hypothetical protein